MMGQHEKYQHKFKVEESQFLSELTVAVFPPQRHKIESSGFLTIDVL